MIAPVQVGADIERATLLLLEQFASKLDAGQDVGPLFDDEASFSTPGQEIRGAGAIATLFRELGEKRAREGIQSRHYVANVCVVSAMPDMLEVESDLLAVSTRHFDPSGSMLIGRQFDRIRHAEGLNLRFCERSMVSSRVYSISPLDSAKP